MEHGSSPTNYPGRSASAIGTLPVSQSRISPVVGDCVVELVGLEPTTKVLWNMVGVRPTPLVGQASRLPGGFGICGISGLSRSVRLSTREFDYLCPLLGLVGDELAEVGGRAGKHSAPRSASRDLTLGSTRAALISLLSRSTISVPNSAIFYGKQDFSGGRRLGDGAGRTRT